MTLGVKTDAVMRSSSDAVGVPDGTAGFINAAIQAGCWNLGCSDRIVPQLGAVDAALQLVVGNCCVLNGRIINSSVS